MFDTLLNTQLTQPDGAVMSAETMADVISTELYCLKTRFYVIASEDHYFRLTECDQIITYLRDGADIYVIPSPNRKALEKAFQETFFNLN